MVLIDASDVNAVQPEAQECDLGPEHLRVDSQYTDKA